MLLKELSNGEIFSALRVTQVLIEQSFKLERIQMSLGTILLIVLILILLGVIPTWPHSRSWGYAPSGVIGTVLIILIILFLLGRI
jgi:hypothetical protein